MFPDGVGFQMFGYRYSRGIDPKPGWAAQSPDMLKQNTTTTTTKQASDFLGPPTLSEAQYPGVGSRIMIFNKCQKLNSSKGWSLKTILGVAGTNLGTSGYK